VSIEVELINSKNIQREQANLSGEKDLKNNNLRKHQDDHTKSTLRLGQLKSRQERRQREEAALKELQENLVALQAELKVGYS
jgi:DNA repair protein RAD50